MKNTPNFTILLPGGCPNSCSFCFWEEKKAPKDWLKKLEETLVSLPEHYTRCSLSGGEPLLSPYFEATLDLVKKTRAWEAIVLTTSGIGLASTKIKGVNHVNISRHHLYDSDNSQIFGSTSVPSTEKLEELIEDLNSSSGIDVNLNCVLYNQFENSLDVIDYIDFAKSTGAQSVCSKTDQRLTKLNRPKELEWVASRSKVVETWSCPVCKVYRQYILGLPVYWKIAIEEPSKVVGPEYELIFQQDGFLAADWEGKLQFIGECVGYGIPYSIQYSAPTKLEYMSGDYRTLDQSEPNGTYSPASADGTWVMMKTPNGEVKPVMLEPKTVTSPFKLPMD